MRCHEVRLEISAFLDGELPPGVVIELEGHFEACAECRSEVESFRVMDADFRRRLGAVEPDPALFARFLEARDRKRDHPAWWRLAWAGVGVAAMLMVAVFGARMQEKREEAAILEQIDSKPRTAHVTNVFAVSRFEQKHAPFEYRDSLSGRNPFRVEGTGQNVRPVAQGGDR